MSGERESLFSAREIAAQLGVVERTVRRWIASGELPATKTKGQFCIALADAEEVFRRSRSARPAERAEWHGRYLEAKERLESVEAELAKEREQRIRLELILWSPKPLEVVA